MQILDQAVETIRKQGAQGAPLAAKLEAIAAAGDQAARLWQGYLDSPGAPGLSRYPCQSRAAWSPAAAIASSFAASGAPCAPCFRIVSTAWSRICIHPPT
jgi:hypothetical protein